MATISGALTYIPLSPAPSAWYTVQVRNPQPQGGAGSPLLFSHTAALNSALGKSYKQNFYDGFGAAFTPEFTTQYYNRIHVNPPSFDAGNVSTTVSYKVEVWNAFFETKNLSNILQMDSEGINVLNGLPIGSNFSALQNSIYDIEVTPDGPPVILATLRWLFGADYGDHSITGNRLVLFPFRYAGPANEGLSFLTNVLRAYDKEQRVMLRSTPRSVWNLRYKISDASTMSLLKSAMYGRNYAPFGIPLQIYETYQTSPIPIGTTELFLDTTNSDYREGGLVLIYRDNLYNEAKQIATVNPGSLVLERPTELAFPDGGIILPVVICRPDGGVSWEDIGNDVNVAGIVWRALDNVAIESAPPKIYFGYEYWDEWNLRPNGGVGSAMIQPHVIVDGQTGIWDVFPDRDPVDQSVDYSSAADSPAERWKLRLFIMRRMGQLNPFWISSRRPDFVLVQTIGSGESSMVVQNVGQQFRDSKGGDQHFEFILKDGTQFLRKIIGLAGESLDKTEQTIEFDAVLGIDVLPEDIERISYLYFSRLATDDIGLTHDLGIYTSLTVPVISLPTPLTPGPE